MATTSETRRELRLALENRADRLAGFLLQRLNDHTRTEHIMQDVANLHLLLETADMLQASEAETQAIPEMLKLA